MNYQIRRVCYPMLLLLLLSACKADEAELLERRSQHGIGINQGSDDLTQDQEQQIDESVQDSAADSPIVKESEAGEEVQLTAGQVFCMGAESIGIDQPQLIIQRQRLCENSDSSATLKQLSSPDFAYEGVGAPNLITLMEEDLGNNRTLMELAGAIKLSSLAKESSNVMFGQLLENGTVIDGMTKRSVLQSEQALDDNVYYKNETWRTTFSIRALFINLRQEMDVELKKYKLFEADDFSLLYQTELITNPNDNISKMARTIAYMDDGEGQSYFIFQMQIEMNNYGQHAQVFGNFEITARQMIVDAWNLSNTLP